MARRELDPSPKAAELAIARMISPNFAGLRFRPGKGLGFPWWLREAEGGERTTLVSVQADRKAKDPYRGGGLRLEFELARESQPNRKLSGRALFFQLLSPEEESKLLRCQNQIIAGLERPPSAWLGQVPEFLHDNYWRTFAPQESFDAINCWLRFSSDSDLLLWYEQLWPLLPTLIDRAEDLLDPEGSYLGCGKLVTDLG